MRTGAALSLAALALLALPSGRADGASASSIYDMNRMLSAPHPLAHQYGTRWRPAPVAPPAPAAPAGMPQRPATSPPPPPAPRARPRPRGTTARPAAAPAKPAREGLGGVFSEIRVGALAHDVGPFSSRKEEGADAQVELRFVSPEVLEWLWAPYPHIGANISTAGDTSSVWAGLVWEKPVWRGLFAGFSLGGAYHDGETDQGSAPEDRKELGCNPLFRLALNLGWRFDEHHSVDAILDHISNAKICDTNEGLENVGIRYGYRF